VRAICIENIAGQPELVLRELPPPKPQPAEILVRVRCAGVNFADLYRAARHFGSAGDTSAAIAGLEMTGEVVEVGSEVRGVQPGDRVMGFATGAYAEYCCVHHAHVLKVPDSLSWVQAASVAGTFVTAHDALVSNGEMAPGESVLIHAASSGVGIAAVQLARLLGAGLVMGTSTSPPKLEKLVALGMQLGIDSKKQDFAEAVLDATQGRGVDVVIDNVGGDTLPGNIRCAAVKCRIINVGRLGKWTGEVNLDEHSKKRIRHIGVTFRTRTVDEVTEVVRRAGAVVLPALQAGTLRPVVDRTWPLEAAAEAQEFMRAGRHFGKLVLEVA
jgi:NADPH2:quinone reductase